MSLAPTYLERAATEALSRGRLVEAEQLLREALNGDPKDYRCLVMLAHVLRERGEPSEAGALAERGIRLKPNMVEAHYQFGLAMLEMGQPLLAQPSFARAVELRPEIADFHLNLGLALELLGRARDARRCFERAFKLKPDDLRSRLSLASRLMKEEDLFGARRHVEAALLMAPNSVAANLAMAEICIIDREGASGDEFIMRALEADPNCSLAYALLGQRQSQMGLFAEAEESFRRSIKLNPRQGHAYLGIAQSQKLSSKDGDFIEQMEGVVRGGRLMPSEESSLHFALAKAYENLGRFEDSMREYDAAHHYAYAYRYGDKELEKEEYVERMGRIRSLFSPSVLNSSSEVSCGSNVPVFIVGMIRSGTTLTEQILSSHRDVAAAGEQKYWRKHGGEIELMKGLLLEPAKAKRAAENYVEELLSIFPQAKRVTDKLPGNYQRLGLIRRVLPNAKIIHCRRSPIDTALSAYVTPNSSATAFSLTKEGIVFSYRQYLEMMRYWREHLPESHFMEVDYEKLVSDPEPTIRSLLKFCDLEWDDACLHPELNSKEVSTPSLWQVRQPIYKSSVERWRKFEPWLGELKELTDEPA